MKLGQSAITIFLCLVISSLVWCDPSVEERSSRDIQVDVTLLKNRLWTAKSEFLVEAPPEKVWHVVVEDIDHWSEYVPRILFSKVVSQETADQIVKLRTTQWEAISPIVSKEEGPVKTKIQHNGSNEWSFFKVLLMDLPWPVANRWVLQKEMDRFNGETNSYSRRFVLVVGNLVVAEGYWRAGQHPSNLNGSLVYYENSYDPGFQVPEFLFKPIVRSDTRKIMEAVRERAEQLEIGRLTPP